MTDGNILIVDDSEGIRQSVGRYLLGLGYRCATAGDGREGLQKLREDDFDVALIDLMMPKVDGLGLLRAMEEADLDTVPIVLSGQAEVSQAVEATRRGAFDFIEKPAGNETIRWTCASCASIGPWSNGFTTRRRNSSASRATKPSAAMPIPRRTAPSPGTSPWGASGSPSCRRRRGEGTSRSPPWP